MDTSLKWVMMTMKTEMEVEPTSAEWWARDCDKLSRRLALYILVGSSHQHSWVFIVWLALYRRGN